VYHYFKNDNDHTKLKKTILFWTLMRHEYVFKDWLNGLPKIPDEKKVKAFFKKKKLFPDHREKFFDWAMTIVARKPTVPSVTSAVNQVVEGTKKSSVSRKHTTDEPERDEASSQPDPPPDHDSDISGASTDAALIFRSDPYASQETLSDSDSDGERRPSNPVARLLEQEGPDEEFPPIVSGKRKRRQIQSDEEESLYSHQSCSSVVASSVATSDVSGFSDMSSWKSIEDNVGGNSFDEKQNGSLKLSVDVTGGSSRQRHSTLRTLLT
jgi:hypothetical protein